MDAEVVGALALVFGGCAVAAWLITPALRHWLQRAAILDIPNARSMHQQPTPRGAGIGLAGIVLAVQVALIIGAKSSLPSGWVLLLAGAGFAVLGWRDDQISLPVRVRLLWQVVLAAGYVGALIWLLPASVVDVATLLAAAARVIVLVWVVNLFNFMDGADALAASQTVLAALAGGALLAVQGAPTAALLPLAIAGVAAGFLRWNWPPAKIFLGDSGSYFFGFQFGALIVTPPFATTLSTVWMILMAPFVVDASLTLAARVLRA